VSILWSSYANGALHQGKNAAGLPFLKSATFVRWQERYCLPFTVEPGTVAGSPRIGQQGVDLDKRANLRDLYFKSTDRSV
jgi:hypothetical protein